MLDHLRKGYVMTASRFFYFTLHEMEGRVIAHIRLTDQHNDGSREELVLPLRIPAVVDAEDLESWCREHLAAAVETV